MTLLEILSNEVRTFLTELIDLIKYIWGELIIFITKFIPISLFLGVILSHLQMLVEKKSSISSVFMSITGSFIVVYFATPALNIMFEENKYYGVIMLAIGYFIQYIIKFVTNQKRVNKWLLGAEKFILDWIKNKLQK